MRRPCVLAGVLLLSGMPAVVLASGWPAYGGDTGGSRFSSADQIDRSNVDRLEIAWQGNH